MKHEKNPPSHDDLKIIINKIVKNKGLNKKEKKNAIDVLNYNVPKDIAILNELTKTFLCRKKQEQFKNLKGVVDVKYNYFVSSSKESPNVELKFTLSYAPSSLNDFKKTLDAYTIKKLHDIWLPAVYWYLEFFEEKNTGIALKKKNLDGMQLIIGGSLQLSACKYILQSTYNQMQKINDENNNLVSSLKLTQTQYELLFCTLQCVCALAEMVEKNKTELYVSLQRHHEDYYKMLFQENEESS